MKNSTRQEIRVIPEEVLPVLESGKTFVVECEICNASVDGCQLCDGTGHFTIEGFWVAEDRKIYCDLVRPGVC